MTARRPPGRAAVRYQVTTVNGEQTDKVEVGRATTVEPVATQIAVGTKTTLSWDGNQVFFNDTEFGVNWDGLAFCESTHNPDGGQRQPVGRPADLRPVPVRPADLAVRRRQRQPGRRLAGGADHAGEAALPVPRPPALGLPQLGVTVRQIV